MESIIKKRIVIRLDENKSLTEIPEGIVEQKCFYKINYYLFLFIALSSKRKNKIINCNAEKSKSKVLFFKMSLEYIGLFCLRDSVKHD